ncbi:MAG: protein kinase [Crocinitomicaceae bacterium]|nr:protein kinase [Crocinitomicaceae bacterium]
MSDSKINRDQLNTKIKNHTLIEVIGQGGDAVVIKALDNRNNKIVAIKLLRTKKQLSSLQKKHQQLRFKREIVLCSKLNHPNIIKLLENGQTKKGELYAVYEYFNGETLKDSIIKSNGLSPQILALIMIQVLDALIHIHKNSIIHCDLKPENIMISSEGSSLKAKIMDFGISKITRPYSTKDNSEFIQDRKSMGTPAYSAPEQLRGEQPTIKFDLYAWGLIFLEGLTGKRVIEGNSILELIKQQLSSNPIYIPPQLTKHKIGRLLRNVLEKNSNTRCGDTKMLYREISAMNFEHLKIDFINNKNTVQQYDDTETIFFSKST